MRLPYEQKTIFSNKPLTNNAVNVISAEIPITGEVYSKIRLIFAYSITISGGSGAIALGGWNYIKRLLLKTDKNEVLFDACGRALYYLNYRVMNTEPVYDTIAATTGTYYVVMDLPFHLFSLIRPEDFYLFSGQYKNLELQITTGGISDFLSTPGSSSLSASLTMVIEKTKTTFDSDTARLKKAMPTANIYIKQYPQIAVATQPYVNIEVADDLAILEIICANTTSPSSPFVGTYADNLGKLSFYDNYFRYFDQVDLRSFRAERKTYFNNDLTGIYLFNFVKNGSIRSAYPTGRKSEVKISVDEIITGTNYLDTLIIGFRAFRI